MLYLWVRKSNQAPLIRSGQKTRVQNNCPAITVTDERNVRQIPLNERVILPFVIFILYSSCPHNTKTPQWGSQCFFIYFCLHFFIGGGGSVISNLQKLQNFN